MTNSFELTRTPKFDQALEELPKETKNRILKKLKEFAQQVNEYWTAVNCSTLFYISILA